MGQTREEIINIIFNGGLATPTRHFRSSLVAVELCDVRGDSPAAPPLVAPGPLKLHLSAQGSL